MFYVCTRFCLNTFNDFRVMERTRFVTDRNAIIVTDRHIDGQTDKCGKINMSLPEVGGET